MSLLNGEEFLNGWETTSFPREILLRAVRH